ncbi:hypothetical protein [Streptomyces sp. NPDC050704]|uniref:hypothetical protein n=1 Tax=Streptomyces sp. NPDC050704 TaxID=3157219 RepID=UPI00342B78B7
MATHAVGYPAGCPVGVSDQSMVTTNTSVPAKSSTRIVLSRSSTIAYSYSYSG